MRPPGAGTTSDSPDYAARSIPETSVSPDYPDISAPETSVSPDYLKS